MTHLIKARKEASQGSRTLTYHAQRLQLRDHGAPWKQRFSGMSGRSYVEILSPRRNGHNFVHVPLCSKSRRNLISKPSYSIDRSIQRPSASVNPY